MSRPVVQEAHRTRHHWAPRLYIHSGHSPGRIIASRLGLVIALVGVVLGLLWLERDGLRDNLDNRVSFRDVVYFTAVTITTVGYGDIVPVSPRARLLDALMITPLRLVIWLIFLGTAYEFVLQRWLENWRMNRLQTTLTDHVIICGFGHSGQSAAQESAAHGFAAGKVLIIDRDPARLQAAAACGYVGLLGDPTREQDLADAGVERAQSVLICLGRDDAAVLAVLTVRQISPSVRIICNVAEEENIKLIRQAGADAVVAPSKVGGYLMADSIHSSYIADYISDLMSSGGRVQLRQRPAQESDLGKPMRDLGPGLVVRLYRGQERIGFWEGDTSIVQSGDVMLVIEPVSLS